MRRLQLLQFAHQRVVFGVTDLRLIEYVVLILVVPQLFAQFLDAFDRFTTHRRLL